jgi:putative PEP-CTERM system histidine kinase
LSLSEKLVRAKEMEAFQVMSAFLVHDLKNTASALSLTLRNLPVHFDNPAFREDALRTLSRSVQRVNELIGRLSTLRQKLELQRRPTDVNQLVATAIKSMGDLSQIALVQDCQPLPAIPVDAAQIESVIVNLLLNAREAISGPGEIHVSTRSQDGDVLLVVRDTGCGISRDFIANSLFKPFKTSKKNGLGIGMYQTKTVVDAHGGRITVESEMGKGTTFCVLLPSKEVASISV